jgi:hypothetical protein
MQHRAVCTRAANSCTQAVIRLACDMRHDFNAANMLTKQPKPSCKPDVHGDLTSQGRLVMSFKLRSVR